MTDLEKRIEQVRDALHEAGKGLSPEDWASLLGEIDADITGELDAIEEEKENT